MIVTGIDGNQLRVDIEERSVARGPTGHIMAFAVHSHDDEGHSYFDTYHLIDYEVKDPPPVLDYAFEEVEDAFHEVFFQRITDHPYLTVGKGAWGFAMGGYDAAKVAAALRSHPNEMKRMIMTGARNGALHWMLVPWMTFFAAKHAGRYVGRLSSADLRHKEYAYVQTNRIGGSVFRKGAPWT